MQFTKDAPRGLALAVLAALALGGCQKPEPTAKPSAAASAKAPVAVAIPGRKAGLWEQTVLRDGKPAMGPLGGKISLCLDAATDRTVSVFGRQYGHGRCRTQSLTRAPDGAYAFASTCDLPGGGRITTRGAARGDFGVRYAVHSDSEVAGAPFERMNGRHTMDMTATWKGPCPADMKPGDMMAGEGFKVNVGEMMREGAAAGE